MSASKFISNAKTCFTAARTRSIIRLGQGLLAKYMGKTKLIAETGAGQHGLATAMIGALFGMETKIFMGATDVERQSVNVHKMKLCGAEVISVKGGTGTLKDAINDALRYWTANVNDTFYLFGTAAGPHPYPTIVKHFQSCIGKEASSNALSKSADCPIWLWPASAAEATRSEFSPDFSMIKMSDSSASKRAAEVYRAENTPRRFQQAKLGILHGAKAYLLQDKEGQILDTESVSAGLDYPAVGPEHCYLKDIGRAEYVAAEDEDVLDAFELDVQNAKAFCLLWKAHTRWLT